SRPMVAPAACPPPALPLTVAPIAGLDADTVVLGQFENGTAMLDAQGSNLVKATSTTAPGGIFNSAALRIPNGAGVSIYRTGDDFDVATGTIEMWVQPGSAHLSKVELFSLRGARSLDGDGFNELLVGEATSTPTTTFSRLYFNHGAGLQVGQPALFASITPRGMATGDVD